MSTAKPVRITTYKPPRLLHYLVGLTFLGASFLLYSRPNLDPATAPPSWQPWLARFPAFFAFAHRTQPVVFWGMLGMHVAETAGMARRMAQHGVSAGSALWWKWVGGTFIEGFGGFVRLDEVVRAEEKGKGKAR